MSRCASAAELTAANLAEFSRDTGSGAGPDVLAWASLADDRGVVWRAELAFFQLRLQDERGKDVVEGSADPPRRGGQTV